MSDQRSSGQRRVAHVLASVSRAPFLPERSRAHAHENRALPIGFGQTNSQPSTVRTLLEALDARPRQRVLDVGCGSGWTCALLAAIVGGAGRIVGVELVPELAAQARDRLAGYPQVEVLTAEQDVLGAPEHGPYDRILVSAEARAVPDPLIRQLADGGRLVAPVDGVLTVVRRDGDRFAVDTLPGRYSFVPLLWADEEAR